MQLMIIGLFLLLYLNDQVTLSDANNVPPWVFWSLVIGLKVVWVGMYALACRVTRKRLASPNAARHLRRLELVSAMYRVGVLVLYGVDLYLGVLTQVRGWIAGLTGIVHPVLIDELIVMLPALLMWGAGWWLYYPIERRLRESMLMRHFDMGLPVYPIWSRKQYVLSQYRFQVLLMLLPLICVIAWTETVELWLPEGTNWLGVVPSEAVTVVGCGIIFIFAPLIIRLAWDTAPLPAGELRDHLIEMCKLHKVRVRELLLWRTYGGMINAAVMGLIGPMRYILITDGLLQQMPTRHVEAVMAHELAHVRKRHMLWLLIAAIALMGVVELSAVGVLTGSGIDPQAVDQALSLDGQTGIGDLLISETGWLLIAVTAGSVWLWAFGFGWVSRRIERQADSFAAAHLARERGGETVEEQDALAMIHALQHVADLNHVRAEKHSWRHGSIAWRQRYLRSLVGQRVTGLPIDRQMRWVNALGVAAVAISVGMHYVYG